MKKPEEKRDGSRLPITLRAQLAADCSNLPRELRHFIHVLALHADNRTGRGLTGQAMLGLYMGLGRVQVGRLWARLDSLWEAHQSPVGALREARHHTSDSYQIVIAPDAALQREKLQPHYRNSSAAGVDVTSQKVDVASGVLEVTPRIAGSNIQGAFNPPQCSAQGSISSENSLQSELLRREKTSTPPSRPDGRGGEAGAAPLTTELLAPPAPLSLAELQALPEWQQRPEDDGMSLSRRRTGLKRLHGIVKRGSE